MPEEANISDRLARVESILADISHQLDGGGQIITDRMEKIVTERLEPIKDNVRDFKTRLESLEKLRNWNLPGTLTVLAGVAAVLTWLINNSAESTKAEIHAELESKVNAAKAVLTEKFGSLQSNFSDVDAKFKANAELRNVQLSEQQRLDHMMWNALKDTGAKLPDYPSGPFFQPSGGSHE